MTYWNDKAVLITGGARGQGAAEAKLMLEQGAHVIVTDVWPEDSEYWTELRASAGEADARLTTLTADVTSEADWAHVVEVITALGVPLYGLVNNAGIAQRQTLTDISVDDWRKVIDINLTGVFLGTKAIAPLLPEGGSVVNISSTAGLQGYFAAAYTASKWGVRGLTKASAIDLSRRGIRVNSISPGLIESGMLNTANAGLSDDLRIAFHDALVEATPEGRGGDVTEIATVVSFLLGPDSRYINAEDIAVDGGFTGGGLYYQIGVKGGRL